MGRLGLSGAIGAIKAIRHQCDITQKIRTKAADHLLALEENRSTFTEDVRLFFNRKEAGLDVHQTTDVAHRRIEVRRKNINGGHAYCCVENGLYCCWTLSSMAVSFG